MLIGCGKVTVLPDHELIVARALPLTQLTWPGDATRRTLFDSVVPSRPTRVEPSSGPFSSKSTMLSGTSGRLVNSAATCVWQRPDGWVTGLQAGSTCGVEVTPTRRR